MIIFDIDCLANDEHRRHLLEPDKYSHLYEYSNYYIDPIIKKGIIDLDGKSSWRCKKTGKPFETGRQAYYDACDNDNAIEPIVGLFDNYIYHYRDEKYVEDEIQIWTGRCESVRKKTMEWLETHTLMCDYELDRILKMRPIGDSTPVDKLKEKWLDEAIAQGKKIEMVFDDRPKVIRMWRRRGVFVLNCCQHDEEF